MLIARSSSPHLHAPVNTNRVMHYVLFATIPGFVGLCWNFGWGSAINILIASVTALALEAGIVALRQRPVLFYLRD
jgi:electron transport complex protein RnfD